MQVDTAAVIVAAGRGERAGAPELGPKQYRLIGERTILRRTLDAFNQVPRIVVVIHRDDEALLRQSLVGLARPIEIVTGGRTRQESVLRGLEALADRPPAVVLVHDAARPFVEPDLIARVIEATAASGGGIVPATAIVDTLKRVSGDRAVETTIDRQTVVAVQTPQGFPYQALTLAHRSAAAAKVADLTDDASVFEWAGMKVQTLPGSPRNIKITTQTDFETAQRCAEEGFGMTDVRTGNGYDVHRLVPGSGVTLCGVFIVHDQALDGHSDADVGLHALTDALLGTCGLGDIGDHFPPSDPQWRGASSDRFVRHARSLVETEGGSISNVDVSLICEAPKIAGHRESMRRTIAEILGLELKRVSVKATTNEAIGFVGRREGIAALATATVVYGAPR